MKTAMIIELKPFVVPNYVIPANRSQPIPLRDLDKRTLERMCEEFRLTVFEKAGISLNENKLENKHGVL